MFAVLKHVSPHTLATDVCGYLKMILNFHFSMAPIHEYIVVNYSYISAQM